MYSFETGSSEQTFCRTENGLEMRQIVRWMISEPGSPWCAAQLAVVELRNGEQIGWDPTGQPIARRTRVSWQRTTADGRVVLADLAYAVLEEIAHEVAVKRCDELVAGVGRWADRTGRPPVGVGEISNAIRFLRKKGYVERAPHAGSPAAYRLTPSGYAATVLHRRARRQDKTAFDPPTAEQTGESFEELEIRFLDLPRPTREALAGAGVATVRELARISPSELPRLAGVGEEDVAEIATVLAALGLRPA